MTLSRRRFLLAAGAATLAPRAAGQPDRPPASPMVRGPYRVGRALLGVTPATFQPEMPAAVEISAGPGNTIQCRNGMLSAVRPGRIAAAIHYPAREDSADVSRPIGKWIDRSRAHPLILYAHAKRRWLTCPEHVPTGLDSSLADPGQDFRRADRMLSHLASHGFVVVTPELGWLVETFEQGDWAGVGGLPRSRILLALHAALSKNAAAWFGERLDLERLALVGHSTGAAACLAVLERLQSARMVGLIAPGVDQPEIRAQVRRAPATLIIASELELQLPRDPAELYLEAAKPKVLVRLVGANHLGYTELCSEDNKVCIDGEPPALIPRSAQQDTAAGFLAAMARLTLLGEESMRRYLDGSIVPAVEAGLTAEWR